MILEGNVQMKLVQKVHVNLLTLRIVDEMQLHVPQDYATVNEIESLMGVNNHIVSSQANKPIMGIVQDGLISLFILTHPDTKITKTWFMDCVFSAGQKYVDKLPSLFERVKKSKGYSKNSSFSLCSNRPEGLMRTFGSNLYTGKNLFSILLPPDFYYTNKEVVIENGVLISGIITSKTIGKSYYSIAHRLYKEYSIQEAADFLTEAQFLANRFLEYHGFSVGLSDFIVDQESKMKVDENVQKAYIEVKNIQNSDETEKLKEFKINSVLNSVGYGVPMSETLENRLETMIKSGSKGNQANIKQIKFHLGQNTVEGKRVQLEIDDGQRTLFCFERGDHSPVTRGFIENSFMEGLTPAQMVFHTKAGREGVINTAVKTQDSGYTERKLVKRMEDIIVENDFTVRNSIGNIVQFVYGGDSLDPTFIVTPDGNQTFIDINAVVNRLNCDVLAY